MSHVTGRDLIDIERQRQVDVEGYTPAHDITAHGAVGLWQAATTYEMHDAFLWPFADPPKFKNPLRDLIRAGALYQAAADIAGHHLVAEDLLRKKCQVADRIDDILAEARRLEEVAESRVTPGITPFSSRERLDGPGADLEAILRSNVEWTDAHLDAKVGQVYIDHPLAQDWARVAKVVEEAGEAINELIGMTGQNPRKGVYSDRDKLLGELADTALTGIYAIQHFTKDIDETLRIVAEKSTYHRARIEAAS